MPSDPHHPHHADAQLPDRFVAADWRWRCATQRAAADRTAQRPTDDQAIRDATRFLQLCRQGPSGRVAAEHRFPRLARAEQLWLDAAARSQIMLLVLGDTPLAEIAELVGEDPAVVAIVEELFFDVRPALAAAWWVHATAIAPTERAGDIELATKLKAAYCGGPLVARALVTAACRVPNDEAERLAAQQILLHAKFQAALEYPVNDEHWLEFLKLALDFQQSQALLKQRQAEFAHRCKQDMRRYALQQQRLALQAARQGISPTRAPAHPSPQGKPLSQQHGPAAKPNVA